MKLQKILIQLSVAVSFLSAGLSTAADARESVLSAAELKTSADRLLKNGRVPAAIEAYRNALSLDPSFKEVYFNLAVANFTNQNFSEAMLCLEKLLILNPSDSEAAYNLACLYLYEKNIPKTRHFLEMATSCCPETADLKPLIQKTLGLLDRLQTLDPQAQDFVLTRIISNARIHAANPANTEKNARLARALEAVK